VALIRCYEGGSGRLIQVERGQGGTSKNRETGIIVNLGGGGRREAGSLHLGERGGKKDRSDQGKAGKGTRV